MKSIAFLLIGLLTFSFDSFSQQDRALIEKLASQLQAESSHHPATTVYLRSNKDIYVAGEDCWFHAFVLDAGMPALSVQDKILYLQLVRQADDSVMWKELYAIADGIAAGHVYLPHTLNEGKYFLKVYTAHSFFAGLPYFLAATPVEVVKAPRSIKRYGQLVASLPFHASAGIRWSMKPEAGELVEGINNSIAFIATDANGQPLDVQGTLLKDGTPLLRFGTLHAGMGQFTFKPEAKVRYSVAIDGAPDSVFRLPVVVPKGLLMRIEKNSRDSIWLKVLANGLPAQTVLLSIQSRGMLQAIATGVLKDSIVIRVPVAEIPAGVAVVSLYNEQLQVLAKRLAFIQPAKRLNFRFSEVKDVYAQKEEVTIRIKTTDSDGRPVRGMVSLRVFDQLFADRKNGKDILNHYQLSTQLAGNLADPAWYFDSSNADRAVGLDLLLQTAGFQRYYGARGHGKPVLSDSLEAMVAPVYKNDKQRVAQSLMVFNHNKTNTQVVLADSNGRFCLTPDHLWTGRRFYLRHFAEKEHVIKVSDPFEAIAAIEQSDKPVIYTAEKSTMVSDRPGVDSSNGLQYGNLLQEVVVKAAGRAFGDRYLGYLDSIAKFEGNTDFVGQCGMLNCPACGSGKKPVEGVTYSELVEPRRSQVSTHPFRITTQDVRRQAYHYPVYTEEDLLKKFKMIMTRGFYQTRSYISPDYRKEDKNIPDMRNSLYWSPLVVTDEKGEATIRFYCSDIRAGFIGIAEGMGDDGSLGAGEFRFQVR
ncbi:hypothetical protein [Paraflavitalea sp. CAU 1676]|uniref:hypothetical protein n=1 Tax=Paraflavitalea sp. CAU 1676 TaxID=3032598 RepID=UPI0023DBC43C|nr:hypothetical protein [Paraflavitalea sp. CAU 1676]MDF2188480.1 hypothetical protein [Paraflavitalea sp. CAU 1676]